MAPATVFMVKSFSTRSRLWSGGGEGETTFKKKYKKHHNCGLNDNGNIVMTAWGRDGISCK